ncbi:MAG: CPBP family intramembrane glutamic endopeptidase [Myxococcota bacterium]
MRQETSAGPLRETAVAVAFVLLWASCFALGRVLHNPTVVLAGLCAVALVVYRHKVVPLLRPARTGTIASVLQGLTVGVATVAVTHLLWPLVGELIPAWRTEHRALVSLLGSSTLIVPLVAFVAAAEELLFRGVLYDVLLSRFGHPRRAAVLTCALYALAQVGSGATLVVLAAVGLGSVWLWLRITTGRLLPSAVAHACWTLSTLFVWPVPNGPG